MAEARDKGFTCDAASVKEEKREPGCGYKRMGGK
jgi:hypothetical protein